MRNSYVTIAFALLLMCLGSCNKSRSGNYAEPTSADLSASTAIVSDSVSSVATMQVEGKQFIKSAAVNMEVKEVYDATIFIENTAKNLGGFVLSSKLFSHTSSENTFATSNENAIVIRKFSSENNMTLRIPTEKLGQFLQVINNKNLFLHSRVISAEDVTANIKLAKLEEQRIAQTGKSIANLKPTNTQVTMANGNHQEKNYQKLANFEMSDQLKYSNVEISLKEPQLRVAQIAITNTKNIDNQYKYNFIYDAKNAVVEGYYLIQVIIVGLLKIWPIIVFGILIIYLIRRKKNREKTSITLEKTINE